MKRNTPALPAICSPLLRYLLSAMLVLAVPALEVAGQSEYRSPEEVNQVLLELKDAHNALVDVQKIGETPLGKDILVATLGKRGADSHLPGIALLGGIEGNLLVGQELILRFAEWILDYRPELLQQVTFYLFPQVSPDVASQYTRKPRFERRVNLTPYDDDRDGAVDEDPCEDLNQDGYISLMRVEDPTGAYITHPIDSRIMIPARKEKGEKGRYLMLSEGIDNDHDGKFNEDGLGGVNFNQSFTYEYKNFEAGAGVYPLSEPHHRAIADFLYEHWNIFAVLSFGPANNLSNPLNYDKDQASKRIINSILQEDQKINAFLSQLYKETVTNIPFEGNGLQNGGFFQWAYFHYGRLSLSTPGWWVPSQVDSLALKDPQMETTPNAELNFLRYAEKEKLLEYFIPWKPIEHPQFENKRVEIGGIPPYLMRNPQYNRVDSIAMKHNQFIEALAELRPLVQIQNLNVEDLGKGLTRIEFKVVNSGYLPTHTEMGSKSNWLRKVLVHLELNNGQRLLAGQKQQLLDRLEGGASHKVSYVIQGKGSLIIRAGAAHCGIDEKSLKL